MPAAAGNASETAGLRHAPASYPVGVATGILLYWVGLIALAGLAGWSYRALHARDRGRRVWLGLGILGLAVLAAFCSIILAAEPHRALTSSARIGLVGIGGLCLGLLALVDLAMLLSLAGASILALPASWHLRRAQASEHDPDAAAAAYERSLQVLKRSGSLSRELHVLNELGTVSMEAGDTDRADDSFRRRVERARTSEDLSLVASALDDYCAALLEMERFDAARERFREALSVAEASRDRLAVARVLYDLGWCEYLAGDAESSRGYLARAVNLTRGARDQLLDVHLLLLGGMLSLWDGDLYESRGAFEDAVKTADAASNPDRLALARFALGVEQYLEGWCDDAREGLESCLMEVPRPTWRGFAGRWLVGLSWVARSAGHKDDGEEFAIWAQYLLPPGSPLAPVARFAEKPEEAAEDLTVHVSAMAAYLDPGYRSGNRLPRLA